MHEDWLCRSPGEIAEMLLLRRDEHLLRISEEERNTKPNWDHAAALTLMEFWIETRERRGPIGQEEGEKDAALIEGAGGDQEVAPGGGPL